MKSAKMRSWVAESSEPSSLGLVALATNPANPHFKNLAFNVLMNPVLEPSKPSSKILLLLQGTQQTKLKPDFLFVLFVNPDKLGKLGFRAQLT